MRLEYCATCGGFAKTGSGHTSSTFHKNANKIRALVSQGHTFEWIGSQFGITKERVRQLAGQFMGVTGAERRLMRDVARLAESARLEIESGSRLGRVLRELQRRSIPYRLVPCANKGYKRSWIEVGEAKKTCRICSWCWHYIAGWRYANMPTPTRGESDFLIYTGPLPDVFFIFPWDERPFKVATFKIDDEVRLTGWSAAATGKRNDRHDYMDYQNAWPLLVERTSSETGFFSESRRDFNAAAHNDEAGWGQLDAQDALADDVVTSAGIP